MSKRLKRYKRIINNPGNLSREELKWLLMEFDYHEKAKRGKGSHSVFMKKGFSSITVPFGRPVKENYVKHIIRIIDLERYVADIESQEKS